MTDLQDGRSVTEISAGDRDAKWGDRGGFVMVLPFKQTRGRLSGKQVPGGSVGQAGEGSSGMFDLRANDKESVWETAASRRTFTLRDSHGMSRS